VRTPARRHPQALPAHHQQPGHKDGEGRLIATAEAQFSKELCAVLDVQEDWPWGSWATRGVSPGFRPADTAKPLKRFGIRPRSVRLGRETAKGYRREQFKNGWRRYPPSEPQEEGRS
jgi:Protein of unknown function (DUF3631)